VPSVPELVVPPSAMGSRQVIRVPGPEADAMTTFPPCSSMRLLTRERPRPVSVCRTPRSNFSYPRRRSACGMPAPVSATVSSSASFWRTASTLIAPARRGEFDRIRDQIEKRLLDPPLVALDRADFRRAAQLPVPGPGCVRDRGSATRQPATSREPRRARFRAPCSPLSIVARSRMSLISLIKMRALARML